MSKISFMPCTEYINCCLRISHFKFHVVRFKCFDSWKAGVLSPRSKCFVEQVLKCYAVMFYCILCLLLVCVCVCCCLMCICCTMCALLFFFFTLDAALLVRSQYSKGPATGHLDTGFFWVSLYL